MELSRDDTRVLKGIAILLMVLLHLFARKETNGLYEPFAYVNEVPFVYYLAILGDACRPIYMFVTGYAFFYICSRPEGSPLLKNIKRIVKLYINFWVVFFIFVPLGFLLGSEKVFVWDVKRLLMDFLGLANNHNGAWWFLQVYIIFVLVSPLLITVIKRMPAIVLVFFSGLLFLVCHIQRYHPIISTENNLVKYMLNLSVLLGTSLLSFVIGACFAKHKVFTRINKATQHLRFKNSIGLAVIVAVIALHSFIESSAIAPFNGVMLICIFTLMNKSPVIVKTLDYLSKHSTNIWLCHMFFYETIFSELVFAAKYPFLIYPWLILLCIAASYIIRTIASPLQRLVETRPRLALFDEKRAGA